MKTIFGKKTQKFISALLVCCMVAGIVGIPMDVNAATITASDLHVQFMWVQQDLKQRISLCIINPVLTRRYNYKIPM